MLKGKTIILGVCGGIPIYKSCEIVRGLKNWGAEVWVVMSENAQKFISPLTFRTLSDNPVITDLFDKSLKNYPVPHITLSKKADLLLIVPATANIIAKAAHGIADDALSTLLISTKCPKAIAPAMNPAMWNNPAVKANVSSLLELGYTIIGPSAGRVICGDEGIGRLAKTEVILEEAIGLLIYKKDLTHLNILITAGATREAIDPIRFLSNRSSGKMGYSLARAAQKRGARVTLISGQTNLNPPENVKLIPAATAEEMHAAVMKHRKNAQVIIMAAAVSDYRPRFTFMQKLQKRSEVFNLELTKTPDILEELGKNKNGTYLIGFAAESNNLIDNAREKLQKKNLDFIVANDVSAFDEDESEATLLYKEGEPESLPRQDKMLTANKILDKIAEGLTSSAYQGK